MGRTQIVGDLLGLHHRGAAFGECCLLAGLRRQPAEFIDGVAQPFRLAVGALHLCLVALHGCFALPPLRPQIGNVRRVRFKAAIGVEQRPVRRGLHEGALVMLTMDLDQRGAERPQDLDADRLVVDESAGAAIGKLHAPQNELVFAAQPVVGNQPARRMVLADFEGGDHLAMLRAFTHQRRFAAGAERKRKGIEQNRFAGAGFASQDGEAETEIDVQTIDQNDIADREPGEHDAGGQMSVER
jgi:hypothetical protein